MQYPNSEIITRSDILSTEGLSHAFISNLPGAAMFVVDRDLRYLLAEGEALAIAGLKPEDFIGRTIFEVLLPELAASYEPMYRQALAGESFEHEHDAHEHTYISRGIPLQAEAGEVYAVLVVSYDITERKRIEDDRKQAEVALRESEARLQSIANLVPDLLWDSDPDGSTNWYNQRWLEYTGQTFEQAIGWVWIDAIHPDDRAGSARRYREAVEQGIMLQQEHRIRRHDGEYRWFVVKASPLKDESGTVIKMYGAATDIHEQRVALEALRESEERFRTLANTAPALIWHNDAQGDNLFINQYFLDFTGKSAEQIRGEGWHELVHPDDVERYIADYLAAVREQRFSGGDASRTWYNRNRIRRYDGVWRWHDNYAQPLFSANGVYLGHVGITIDNTDAIEAEAALRDSEEKYRALYVSMDEAYAVVEVLADDNGEWKDFLFLEVNPAFVEQTGMEYPVGRKATELLGTPNPNWAQIYGQVAETGEPIRVEEGEVTLGRIFDLYVFRLGGEGSRRVAVLFTDITDRKQREQQQAFLLKFSDTLRTESNADAVANRALQMLIEQLQLDRSYITTYYLENNRADLNYQIGNDSVPPLPDHFVLSDFPEALKATFEGTLVIEDDWKRQGLSEAEQRNSHNLGMRAMVAATLRKENHPLWSMVAISSRPRRWTPAEIALVEDVAERTWVAVERACAEAALRTSEVKYRSLFESIDAGFCIFEMLYNEAGEAIDFCYIETNPAFERQSGRRPQPGQTMRELFPEAEDMWLKDYAEVARTGQSKRFIDHHKDLDRWFDVFVFPTSNGENQLAALFSDVTEEKRAEAALRESEDKYRTLFNTIDEGLSVLELIYDDSGKPVDMRWLEANPAFEKITGLKDVAGRLTSEFVPSEDYWLETYDCVIKTGEPTRFENYHAGIQQWYRTHTSRVGGPGSRVVANVFEDITERKRRELNTAFLDEIGKDLSMLSVADEIIQTVGLRLGEFLQASGCIFADVDEAKNEATIHHGWSTADVPSLKQTFRLADYFGEEFLRAGRAGETVIVRDTAQDERANAEAYARLKIGSFVTVPFQRHGIWTANITVTTRESRGWRVDEIELLQEITNRVFPRIERARAEEALRNSEQRLSVIFAQAAVGLSEISLDGHFEQVNDALCQMLGRSRQELLAATVLEVTHPEDVPKSLDALAQLLETGEPISLDKRYLRPDGTVLWATSILTRLDNGQGQPQHILAVTVDLTDRKQAEANEIRLIREQSARAEEHQRAEALAELDRTKTLFFSNVSHEFRTPLTLSLAPLQDALRDRTHPLDPVHRERLELVHRNSLRLLKLVNTLLDFSRIEAGRMEAAYEPIDLATFTAELASVFRSAIERAGLQLIVDCPPLPEPVFVDREMWEKIVLNLLSNAFKFTFEEEIRVSLHSTDSHQAILQIQDTGTGIDSEHLPYLFERFYQVRGTQARTYDGSGIGLALVHELVRLQGGTIEVSSTVGEGACFTIALPFGTDHLPSDRLQLEGDRSPIRTLASTAMGAASYVEGTERWIPIRDNQEHRIENVEEQTVHTADSSALPTLASARVLLADDNADMREYLTRILSDHVQVEAVADGATALAVVQERIPDLILSDVMMPGLGGFELLAALRASPRTREIPIILLSARAGEEAIIEGLEAGADDATPQYPLVKIGSRDCQKSQNLV